MRQRTAIMLAVLLLVVVDWLSFHDAFEPHTIRNYLTLFAS